jgi:DNA-binding LacI/PurR family transcriptional regulator
MVRLKDIAQRANVSVMTVSKALRDAPDISAATKARVCALAQQMGYVPDTLAQGLRTRKSRLLGLVLPAITNPNYVRMLMALEEKCFDASYELLLAHTLNQPEREETAIRRLMARRVDGLMIAPVYRMSPTVPVYQELRQRAIPTVIIGQRVPFCQDFINVESDDLQASFSATQHLLGLGHKRIAFFAGSPLAPWAQERLEGYRRALREAELPVDDHLVFNAGATIEEGEKAAEQMLSEAPQVTAVQAASDLVAIGAGNVLLGRGLRIPQDLSLVGFGNVMASELFRVPLTTIRQPKRRLGVAVMESLMHLLRGEHAESVRLSAELLVRASTGPPPAPASVG